MPDIVDIANDTVLYPEGLDTPMATGADTPKLTATGQPDRRTKAGRASSPTPPAKRAPGRPSNKSREKDYRPGIEGLGQLVGGALIFVAPADGAAIIFHTPPIAQALNDLAKQDPRMAALLDKLLQVGPYGALIAAVAPLIIQILVNHNRLPAGLLGSASPDELVNAVVGGMAA